MQIALTYAPGNFDLRGKVMGRQVAGLGFLRALAGAGLDTVGCYAVSEDLAQVLARDLAELSRAPPAVRFLPFGRSEALAPFGTLYRGDPLIGDEAWLRQMRAGARAYSLCGVTHTLSSTDVMTGLASLADPPLYPWDAIVCTSRVVRDVVLRLLEARLDHLRVRFGLAASPPLPQLPLIPLGVHVADFEVGPRERAASRAALGLAEGDVSTLFAGRISFHGKAHPLPMFLALERAVAAGGPPVTLVMVGHAPNAATIAAFREEAARFAPSVRFMLLDGADPGAPRRAWAAADLFTSLSDNIQETFGLTPIEAMAAGLPCVVSDWDGYKDTVRDGVDGFRIPVAAPPPGTGVDLADRFAFGASDYDRYIGEVSLFAAVDVDAAASALSQLVTSPELRRTMGESGRRRAREVYDWSLIFRRYMALWDDLAERRRSDPRMPGEEGRARRPDRPDPFDLFRTYPTALLGPATRVRLASGATAAEAASRRAMKSVGYAASVLPDEATMARLLAALAPSDAGATVADLQVAMTPMTLTGVVRTVAFLAKMGLVAVEHGR